MSLTPSTYYYRAKAKSAEAIAAETRLVARVHAICAEFPRYGYRRVTAQLKAEGQRVNHTRVSRIMGEQDLRVRPKRRFVVTTDSDHDGPIFPNLANGLAPTGRRQPDSSFGSRRAVRLPRLHCAAGGTRYPAKHEPHRQSL